MVQGLNIPIWVSNQYKHLYRIQSPYKVVHIRNSDPPFMDTCSQSMSSIGQQLFLTNPSQYRLCCALLADGKTAFIAMPSHGPILTKDGNTHAHPIIRPQWFSFLNMVTQGLQASDLEYFQAGKVSDCCVVFRKLWLGFIEWVSPTVQRVAGKDQRDLFGHPCPWWGM